MFFSFPKDGDMLNEYDGVVKGGRLFVQIEIVADPLRPSHADSIILINNIPAVKKVSLYIAEVPLDSYKNTITAYNTVTSEIAEIIVYRLKNTGGKFRLSLDDNIWCMRDLTQNANDYKSVFDNPYFALYKKAHDLYQTKVHMNLYYQCEGFDLSMMPDKYKSEFADNADWLNFSFHALQNDPEKPYINATYEEILRDYDLVTEQILRFAGEECLPPVTTVHWGECAREGVRALRARGIRCLMGYFRFDEAGHDEMKPVVSYYLDSEQAEHLSKRDFWKDNKEDMVFGRINLVLNEGRCEDITGKLERESGREKNDHPACGFLELMMHEQYFYPDYTDYLPDFEQRVLTAVKWATDNGYRPGWVQDSIRRY